MNELTSHEADIRHANIRLCRLRSWSNYDGLGFHITKCSQPPHLISLVESNSPAAASGLRIWDVLIAINNEIVSNTDYNQITMILKATPVDNHRFIELLVVEEDFYRILKKKNIRISSSLANRLDTPIRMPEEYMKFPKYIPRTCEIRLESNDRSFGFEVIHGDNGIGAYIQEVIAGSPANRAGLRKSDRIITINDKYVDTSASKVIYEKLNKALIKRNVKLFVMDTETYKYNLLKDPNVNLDRVGSQKKSTISSVSSDRDSSGSSISDRSDLLNLHSFTREHLSLQNNQQSNTSMTSRVNSRKNSKEFHAINAPLLPIKKPLSPRQESSNLERCNQDIHIFHNELEGTTAEYEYPDDEHSVTSDNQHNANETTSVFLEQNDHYEYVESTSEIFLSQQFCVENMIHDDIQNEPLELFLPIEGYQDMPLLSLNNAVENLEKIIPQIKRNAWIAFERSSANPMDELTSDESASIQLYTMEWKPNDQSLFVKLNHALRANDRNQLTPYFSYLKLVLTALWKLKSLQTIVWRGVHADLRAQYPIGQIFVWWGFSLCVESRDLLESEKYIGNKGVRTLFHIKCKTGKSICLHSYSKQDKEILLLPATQFQVMNQEILTDNLFIIYLREIQPQYTLLQPPFDTDYSIVSLENDSYQNKCLQKFIEDHRMKNSICFSEQSLTIDDIHLITNELHSNKYWNEFSIHRICLNDVHIKDLMYALQSNLIVTYLYLKSNQLNDDTSSIIALALKTNTSLEKIDLTDNQITEIGAQSFANMLLINKTLLSLNLSSNIIGDKGMICLFRALQHNNTLCSLHLNQTKVTNQGIQELAIDLQPKTNLLRLYLNENNLGDEGMIAISHFLVENKQLNSLHLAMNNITFVGAEKIAMILQQSPNSLLELNLSENPLQDAGVIFIAQALIENTILIELHLDSVEMTIYGLEEITNMICINQTLKYLSLKKNEINDDGMVLLLNGLKYNRVLTHLHLNDNKLTDKCISNIVDKIMIRI